ncbi:MAG TPA: lipoprotein insertase outer membrane protein LolB [Burkholderiaceae bacterium]|nr:lipoprotein insertase outer membrane protein LolB [Burkholderiaceae bacterium]
MTLAGRHARRASVAAVVLGAAAWLAGCASVNPATVAGPTYAGKIAVRSEAAPGKDARSMSGQFELAGTASEGRLVLTSPIGTTVARAHWGDVYAEGRPSDIVLEAQGRTVRFSGFEAMTEAALGEALPLEALFDWLAGHPWQGSPATVSVDGGAFDQFGWHVDRSHLATDGLLSADRTEPAPAIHVRIKLDAPETAVPPGQRPPDRRALPVSPTASSAR